MNKTVLCIVFEEFLRGKNLKRMINLETMLFVAVLMGAALADEQLCSEDSVCFDGQFCDTQSSHMCHPCLSCKDQQREEPAVYSKCVKSLSQCGPCLKGLMISRAGDLKCVPHEEYAPPATDNTYLPWIITAVVILIVVAVAVLLYIYLFKKSSFSVGLNTQIGTTVSKCSIPTAPEYSLPPPYSPTHGSDTTQPTETQTLHEETELPLIKTYQPPFPVHLSQDHGKAGVYNPPSYVRLPNPQPIQPEAYNDENGNYSPGGDDEDTTPSPWVPRANNAPAAPDSNGNDVSGRPQEGAGAVSMSAALADACNTDLIQRPPVGVRLQLNMETDSDDDTHPHQHRTSGAGAGGGAGEGAPRTHGNGNYNILNVNQFITFSKQPPF